jgi:uncharacterized protein (TIGR03382 family)
MPCTPYPATQPCDGPTPVHVDPYQPTVVQPLPWDDELRPAHDVPAPAPLVLTVLALAALAHRRRTR